MYATVPMFLPCTVTDTPPLVARLIPFNALVEVSSYETAFCAVAGTAYCPTVMTADRLENIPAGTLHVKWVSDTQLVVSHVVK